MFIFHNYIMESFFNQFTHSYFSHPLRVCMSYSEHFWFSSRLGYKLAIGSMKAFIHAIYPDLFITSTSDLLVDIQEDMKKVGCR